MLIISVFSSPTCLHKLNLCLLVTKRPRKSRSKRSAFFCLDPPSVHAETWSLLLGERHLRAPCEERRGQGGRVDYRPQERRQGHKGPGNGQTRRRHLLLRYIFSVLSKRCQKPLTELFLCVHGPKYYRFHFILANLDGTYPTFWFLNPDTN